MAERHHRRARKKLIEVAEALAKREAPPTPPDEKAAQLRRLGLPEDQIAAALANDAARRKPQDTAVEVLDCNWDPVQVFQRCQQTWISGPGGAAPIGVSALEVSTVSTALGVRLDGDLLDAVRVLSAASNRARKK